MNLQPDQVLSATLRLVRKIADGGMGSVWVAEHVVLGTEVAVKVMSGPWADVPSARTRFLREAKMTAHVTSPHVVRVLDCRLTESDEPYLVLELLRGETLDRRVLRHGALSLGEVVELVAQTCEAVAASHDAGFVHRDIKPENVFLLSDRGERGIFVKLIDWGVAKPRREDECLDVDALPAGTPQYMSPEHLFAPATTDERSDLFSLAAVAYFALTGRSPFEAESLEALYFAIDAGAFTRPSEARPGLPRAIDAWFETALAEDPAKRFASAEEMARAFRAAASPRREVRPPARQAELDLLAHVPGLPRRRRPPRRALAALALASACGLLAWRDGASVPAAVASVELGEPSDEAGAPIATPASAPAPAETREEPAACTAPRDRPLASGAEPSAAP